MYVGHPRNPLCGERAIITALHALRVPGAAVQVRNMAAPPAPPIHRTRMSMIGPAYWAEARREVRHNRKQLIVLRFGWSDDSVAAAQAHADARAQEALHAIAAGQSLPRSELRTN